MPSICFTRISIRHDDKEKLEALHDKINEWTSENFIDNDCGESWLGNVVVHSGIARYVKGEFVGEDGEKVECDGKINDLCLWDDELSIGTWTDWTPMMKMWQLVCDKYLPGAKIIFSASEPDGGLYQTNDPKKQGKFAIKIEDPPEEFADECSLEEEDAESVVEFLQRVLKTDDDDLEELLKLARGEGWFTVEPWEYCTLSEPSAQQRRPQRGMAIMNEKPSANSNGNEAGTPDGKQERKTRTVEVRVSTSGLGTIIVTPVRSEGARAAVREADGRYDAELAERVQECTDWTTVHFADCRGGRGRSSKLKLQVFDGDECILKQDSLPTLDAAYLVGYAKALNEHGEVTLDNFERYEEYNEGEPALYQSVARAEGPKEADCNASMVSEFWKKLQNGKIPEDDLFMIGLVHHIGTHLANPLQDAGAEADGKVAFLDSVGDMGSGEVTFEIEIPENEPFDIDKLHFFCEGDWWDSSQHKAICACGHLLADCSDTSLELLEYDGRIYCRQEADVGEYWSKNREFILVHADLKDFDPEQLGEDDEDEEEKEDKDEGDTLAQISFEGAKTFTLDQEVFKNMLRLVGYAACTDPSPLRARIHSVLLSFKGDHLSAVATDTRRLAIVERKLAFPKSHEIDLIVPLKPIKKLLKTLGDEGEVRISATSKHVAFEYGNNNVITELVDDNYPDFRKAIPAASGNGLTLGRETFLSTLRRMIQLICGDSDDIDLSDFTAKLSLTANQLDIRVTDLDDGEAHERMDVKYSGENVTSAFCFKYLVDPLEHLTTDEISLELLGSTSPGVIRSASGLVYVFMPIRPS